MVLLLPSQTQSAVDKVKALMESQQDAIGLRVGVRTRGCNGLSYTLEYAKEKGKFDEAVTQDGKPCLTEHPGPFYTIHYIPMCQVCMCSSMQRHSCRY